METALESAGIKPSEGGSPSASPESAGVQQKVADLEAKIKALQTELVEEKKKNAPQAIGDLAKDLQAKLKKRDETIARLEAEAKQMRGTHAKEKDLKIKSEASEGGSPKPTPDLLALQLRVVELEERNNALEAEHKTAKKPNATAAIGDLATDLQAKLHKKDELIAKLEAEGKQMRQELAKGKDRPIPDVVKDLEGEIKKRNDYIAKLENELKEMGKPKLPDKERWWY